MFALIAIRGSNLIHNRYLYPIYPIVALITIKTINRLIRNFIHSEYIKFLIISAISIALCVGSIFKYGVDFMYADYDGLYQQAQEIRETDCLLYYGDGWLDVYSLFPLRLLHDETYLMRSRDMDYIAEILSRRNTVNDLVVCLPSRYSDEDTRNILDNITAQAGLQNYRMIYKHGYLQEWIIE